jgi:RNA exonuclease 1
LARPEPERQTGVSDFTKGLDREFSQVAMKRSQPSTTPTPSSPAHKKVKMSPNPFEVLVDDTEDGWTKVEKRKAKKTKKAEAKIDVCVSRLYFSPSPL